MSYETFRDFLQHCKHHGDGDEPSPELIAALEALSDALQSDLEQLKVALGHVAGLPGERDGR